MRIGLLRLYVHLPSSQSLKDKRRVLRSLKDRVFANFNVAIAEIGENDKLQVGELGLVTIANERRFVEQVLQKALAFIEDRGEELVVLESDVEIF